MQNHYNYTFDSVTETYNFSTKNNILYKVSFIVDETFSIISKEEIPNIYQIVIEKIVSKTEPYDQKVSKTIENIIEQFFKKVENSIIYVCSDENEKAKQRHKVFDRWYQKSRYRDIVKKIDNTIKIKDNGIIITKIYTSFMFHKANPNFEKLIEIYNQIEKVLNDRK